MPNLAGKVIIVTGGNSGLGFESVKAFAEKGANVVMACRSVKRGEVAKSQLKMPDNVVVMRLDLADFDAVRAFALDFKQKYKRLDVLMNNAGVMLQPYKLNACGVESHLATNHLGHFLLTHLMLPVLSHTPGARVVSISSLAHRKGFFDFDNINYDQGESYDAMTAYRRSKLASLLFAIQLQTYFEAKKLDVISVAAHPGVVPTNLVNHRFSKFAQRIIRPVAQLVLQNPARGVLPQLRASVAPDVSGGDYYGPSASNEWRGYPVLVLPEKISCRQEWAKQLWVFSEKITGCKC